MFMLMGMFMCMFVRMSVSVFMSMFMFMRMIVVVLGLFPAAELWLPRKPTTTFGTHSFIPLLLH